MKISMHPVRRDLLAALAVAVSAALCFLFTAPGGKGETARITSDGKTVAEIPLDGPVRTVAVCGVCIEAGNGGARILSSDCPNQICVHQGMLTLAGESAVCVPNRVVLTIIGSGGVDAVA